MDNTINNSQSINFLLTLQRCCYLGQQPCINFFIKGHITAHISNVGGAKHSLNKK